MRKILIIQTAFIGDVILATPLASNLKIYFPEASIDFLVKKGNESLLLNHQSISKVWTFNKKEGKIKSMLHLIRTLRKEKYDWVINLHRFGSSGLIAGLSGAKKIEGFSKNPFSFLYSKGIQHEIGNGKHEVDRNLEFLIQAGFHIEERRPSLFPSEKDIHTVQQYTSDPYFCFAPASVWFTKQLPEKKWIELLQKYAGSGKLYLLGGKEDYLLCQQIIELSKVEAVNLAGQLTLLQSAALMTKAERCFVNDSGPMHLASSVNAPVTAFFCSTTPGFGFGPLSEDSEIIESPHPLKCKPCGLHGHAACPLGDFKCGNEIEI